MILKLGELEIHSYDKTDSKQWHLKYVLDNDEYFRENVTKKIDERLNKTANMTGDGLQFDDSYLIKYKGEFVGYIRLENLRWDGTLDITWAVFPEFRNQKYGKAIVETVSDYILENYGEVKKLRGVINKSNYISRKVAISSGFTEKVVDYNCVHVTKTR